MKIKGYIYSLLHLSIFVLSLVTDSYAILVYALTGLSIIMVLDKLGKGIVLREMMALHGCFVCLLMPLMGYLVYNERNVLSILWRRYMPVPDDVYFGFALPAMAGFIFALCWPLNKAPNDHGEYLQQTLKRSKTILERIPTIGVYLLAIGVAIFSVADFLPSNLQFAFLLFYFSSFAGLLYVYFTPKLKYRIPILLLFALFIVFNALRSGMFTIIAYMGITLFSFLFIGKKTQFWKKLSFFVLGIFALFIIQSVKQNYRTLTWRQEYKGNRAVLFTNLVKERVGSSIASTTVNSFFPMYYRANQGFNVSLVMKHIPKTKPHDNGVNLMRAFAASLIPRVLWPDKPEAGGRFNMKYYTGYTIKGWSTNIGPLGEAYGSFGVTNGIIYMIFLGAFIRWSYKQVFRLSFKIPLILFWIPVLFYQITYSLESDTLQILNSLFKSAFFIWILIKVLPAWFGIIKDRFPRKRTLLRFQ